MTDTPDTFDYEAADLCEPNHDPQLVRFARKCIDYGRRKAALPKSEGVQGAKDFAAGEDGLLGKCIDRIAIASGFPVVEDREQVTDAICSRIRRIDAEIQRLRNALGWIRDESQRDRSSADEMRRDLAITIPSYVDATLAPDAAARQPIADATGRGDEGKAEKTTIECHDDGSFTFRRDDGIVCGMFKDANTMAAHFAFTMQRERRFYRLANAVAANWDSGGDDWWKALHELRSMASPTIPGAGQGWEKIPVTK